jgi:uncharacterized membrane protein (TIGR02234 family)
MADADALRRSYALTVVVGLASAGAITVGAAQPWVTATASPEGLPQISASVDGADIAPVVGALGFVLLAAFGAVIATRGWVRRAVGVVIIACSVVVLVAAARAGAATDLLQPSLSARGWSGGSYDSRTVAWRWVVVAAAALCLLAGLAVVRFATRWATMGSRYDAPANSPVTEQPGDSMSTGDVWKAIDRGHDPTQTS